MKRIFSILATVCLSLQVYAATEYMPKAASEAEVVCDRARFTVLTSRLIRMEWAEDGKFEDRASFTIVNRYLPVPSFTKEYKDGGVIIRTDDVALVYLGGGRLSKDNLSVRFTLNGEEKVWRPGDSEEGNLLGTLRTLDGCKGFSQVCYPNKGDRYDKGVISRDGWAIIDESQRHLFQENDSDWGSWVAERPEGDRQDMYIFAYGHDYKSALNDYTKISGKVPLPPKYMFGYWWSHYWQYSDFEFVDLAKKMRSLDVPIDVMVIDMDWHDTYTLTRFNAVRDEFWQKKGWTGYSWKKQLFPNPTNFLTDLHNMNFKTSLNLHPASGIYAEEDCYEDFVKDYLSRTDDYDGPESYVYTDKPYKFKGNKKSFAVAGEKATVPFRICQQAWADAYFKTVIRPLEKMGVDFWWLDYQQWLESKYVKGLNNTFWLNHTFFHDKVRQSVTLGKKAPRPVIYHRWGGMGSHRYQIGFSGDTYALWSTLEFLPYFTSTSSNVCYGYWGHDIGAHQHEGTHPTDPEMYTRWLQYGVFTPIYKTHSAKRTEIERRIWMFPEYFDAMKAAVRLRYNLSPYIYTAARQSYDEGICICRPLYYDYPENPLAYSEHQEFMFGDNILATVLCQPMDKSTGLTERRMWFPEGDDWYDVATGHLYEGGSTHVLKYTIDENPYFVKAGAVIPMASEKIGSLQEVSNEYTLFVAPGLGKSSARLYEDDGDTQSYETDFAVTEIEKASDASSLCLIVAPRKGKYEGMSKTRKIKVKLECVYAPVSVKINGREIPYSRHASAVEGGNVWGYSGVDLSAEIYVPEMSAAKKIVVECRFDESQNMELLKGKKGLMSRAMKVTPAVKMFYAINVDNYKMLPDGFLNLAQCSSFITEQPYKTEEFLKAIDKETAHDVFSGAENSEAFVAKLKAQFEL